MDKRIGRDTIRIQSRNHRKNNTNNNIPYVDKCNNTRIVEISKDKMENKKQQNT